MARRQKQLNPIVTVGNKITKAVRSDKAEFQNGKNQTSTSTHERHSWAAAAGVKCSKVLNVITFQRNCNHSPKGHNIWP